MQYVNRMIELENKLTAVDHAVGDAEKKRIMLRGLRAEYVIIAVVVVVRRRIW